MLLILFDSDAYSPLQIAAKVEEVGLKKANLGRLPPCVRGFLAGGFIGLEAAFYNGVSNDSELNFAYKQIPQGSANKFSQGSANKLPQGSAVSPLGYHYIFRK